MERKGQVASGCFNVMIGGKQAARKGDLTDHGGLITTGCVNVMIGGKAFLAARTTDWFTCPTADAAAHVGGIIQVPCCDNVKIGMLPAARMTDPTLCLGPGTVVAGAGGGGGGDGGDGGADNAECKALWEKYGKEAKDMLAPGDHDHRQRNRIITGAYADLFLRNPDFMWAGLAAYASKQVGCAMDYAKQTSNAARRAPGGGAASGAVAGISDYTLNSLGEGNRDLFLDIYPMHRFFEEQGFDKMNKCAGARQPPMNGPALDGFRAIDQAHKTGDRSKIKDSVASFAAHEQISILQNKVYNDQKMRLILRANETGMPLTQPAEVIMAAGCSDPTGTKTHVFGDKGRTEIYNVGERMDWIMNDIAKDYFGFAGSPRHTGDLEVLRSQGASVGGKFPAAGAKKP